MNTDYNEIRPVQLHLYDGLEEFPCTGENFLIPGPAGVLEAMLKREVGGEQKNAPIAVVCHPHPLHGGSMTNKVVHIIADTFHKLGAATLRFNFRGVGQSQGRFDQGKGEQQDLKAIIDWMRQHYPYSPLWLAGFSFGSYVAYQMHQQLEAERLLVVAPPLSRFAFDVKHVDADWMVIQGGKDDVVSPQDVSTWVHAQIKAPKYHWITDADHFFHGRLNRIRDAINTYWQELDARVDRD